MPQAGSAGREPQMWGTVSVIRPFSSWTSRERLSGCQKALWEAGLELDRELIFESFEDGSKEFGYQTIRKLLAGDAKVDGLFIANHPIAEGALRALGELSCAASKQMKICSFDEPDSPFSAYFHLIIVKQPVRMIGARAGKLLLERIDERASGKPRTPGRHIMLSPQIQVKPPRAAGGAS